MCSSLQPFPLGSGTCGSWRLLLLAKSQAKKAFSNAAFPMSWVTRSPNSSNNGATFLLVFLLPPVYIQKPFLSLTDLARSNSSGALAFLTSSLYAWRMFLNSFQVTHPCFHPLYASFLCLSLTRSILLIYTGLLALLPDFLLAGMNSSWAWRRWSLIINKLSWTPLPSRALFHGTHPNGSWRGQSSLVWTLGLWACLLHSFLPDLHHLMVATAKAANKPFIGVMRSNRAWLFIGPRCFLWRESLVYSRKLLDCLCLAMLSLQQISGWLKFPMRTRACEREVALCVYLISLFFLIRQPIAHPDYNVTFTCPLFNPHLWTLIWLLIHPQTESHALQLLFHIKGNSFFPSLSILKSLCPFFVRLQSQKPFHHVLVTIVRS